MTTFTASAHRQPSASQRRFPLEEAKSAMQLAAAKLPVKSKFIVRERSGQEAPAAAATAEGGAA